MEPHVSTTPFGRRPFSLAMMASQTIADACPSGVAVHKWQVFRAICEGRPQLGVSERALAVLNALLTFHPETILTGGADLVVFPSNELLALRAHGMAASTLRRHLAVLVDAGIVIRRDSPNGKRYVRKGRGGEADRAFGFDLTPLVARAAEFEAQAEAVRSERTAINRLRERITIARRDVVKMAAAGMGEGVEGAWTTVMTHYGSIIVRLPRASGSGDLQPIADEFEMLAAEARNLLESHIECRNKSANESRNERHIQNSNPKPSSDLEPAFRGSRGQEPPPSDVDPRPPVRSFPLSVVLEACPDICDYGRGGLTSWRDLGAAAAVARAALGISPSAYEEAQDALGADNAAIVVAAILQKGDAVRNAGAYLRGLTAKAREGGFSPGPMIMALLRTRHRERVSA